jgi:acetyl-CoA carboxylase carboxyl transferase subunit alpha
MTPIERVQLARHPRRPHALDFIARIFDDFRQLHGDRRFGDDPAMVAGLAKFERRPVVVIAHQKGHHVRESQERNFGMPKPEGYRKSLRVMQLAAKFQRPVFTLVDTTGAYPGIDAEQRGQAEAIAYCLREMARLPVPVVVTITGEGGSGGALAVGVGDVVNIMENAIYSVISPEGCAAILWKEASLAPQAAERLKLTAPDLLALGLVDRIVAEPAGGAHENWDEAADLLKPALREALKEVEGMSSAARQERRYRKFRRMGELR